MRKTNCLPGSSGSCAGTTGPACSIAGRGSGCARSACPSTPPSPAAGVLHYCGKELATMQTPGEEGGGREAISKLKRAVVSRERGEGSGLKKGRGGSGLKRGRGGQWSQEREGGQWSQEREGGQWSQEREGGQWSQEREGEGEGQWSEVDSVNSVLSGD